MNSQIARKNINAEEWNNIIINSIQDRKGHNIVKLDLRNLTDAPTDYFIICEGNSDVQVKAIADNIVKEVMKVIGDKPAHVEGMKSAKWVLIDYFNIVIHVFHRETRKFYQLEGLWSDAQVTEYTNL